MSNFAILVVAVACICLSDSMAHGATYYWDGNNGTAGFGNASGTWAASTTGTATAGWSSNGAGTTAINGNSVTITTADSVYFGNGTTGLGAGTITVSGTVNSGDLTFAAGSGAITLNNGTINLANATIVTVDNATNTISSVLSGASTSLTKTGNGRLAITNTGNAYSGNTIVSGGVLRFGTTWSNSWTSGSLPTNSNLEINGGIVEAYYYMTRTLGTGAGQIQITGGRSGFTNLQGDASGQPFVLFTNSSTTVTWGSAAFSPGTLVLNDTGAVSVLRTNNPFNLNGAARTVEVSASGAGAGRGTYATFEGNLSGAGARLVKTGVGTLMLNGTNSYTDGTSINEGAVWFHRTAAMPNSGVVAVADGAILGVSVGNAGQWTTGTSGNGTIGGLLAGLGGQAGSTVTYSGNVGLGLNVTGTQTYSGNIGNVGSSLSLYVGNKDGGTASDPFTQTGTLILSGNNTYTGSTNIGSNSTLRLIATTAASATTSFNLAPSSVLQLRSDTSGTFGNAADINLNLPANGNATTIDVNNNGSGTNNSLTIGGALNARSAVGSGTTRTLNVTGGNGYSLNIGSANITGGNNLTLNPTTADLNIGSITATTGTTVYSGANNITLTLGGAAGTNNSIASITETSNAAQQLIITKNTAATWTLGNVDTQQGNTHSISAGNLVLNGTFTFGTGTATARTFNIAGGTLHWNNTGAFDTQGSGARVTMTGGNIDQTSGAAIMTSTYNPQMAWNADFTFLGSNGADSDLFLGTGSITMSASRQVTVQNAAATLYVGGVISGAGFGLTKAGAGTLTLSGANTYTGATTINGGGLQIGDGGTTGSLSTSSAITNNSNLIFNRSNTITQGTDFANAISGSGTLTQAGSGTLVLSAANSYDGTTNVDAGTLQVANNNALGTTTGNTAVAAGARIFASLNGLNVAEAFELAGNGTSSISGAIHVGGNATVTFSGPISLNDHATLKGDGGTNVNFSNQINTNGKVLTLSEGGGGTMTISGDIVGAGGSLVKSDLTGLLILSGTNTYDGPTTIQGGTLRAGAAAGGQAFGNLSAVTIANISGATLALNNFDQTIGSLAGGGNIGGNVTLGSATLTTGGNNADTTFAGIISGTGGLTKTGLGSLDLTGNNTYSGTTDINNGTLFINGSLSAGGGNVNVNNGATLGGTGTINRNVNLLAGGTHAVGNSIGVQAVLSETWNGGGVVEVEFDNFLGLAGVNWDLLNVTNALTISASDVNPVVLKLISLDPLNDNFDWETNFNDLLIADASTLGGFDPTFFTFDTSMFGHDLMGGQFNVTTDGNGNVFLNFQTSAVVPEPVSLALWMLLSAGLVVFCVLRIR